MTRYVFLLLAVGTIAVSEWLAPTRSPAENDGVNLATLAPREVGEWRMVDAAPDVVLGRDGAQTAERLYDRVLTRTFERARDGAVLWLVVASGQDQRADFALHLPELCYRAYGFEVEPRGFTPLTHAGVQGDVRQVLARSRERIEPISYWVVMGDDVVTSQFAQKLRQLWYGLTGQVRRGTLVRVSIPMRGGAVETAYREQQAFIHQLLAAWPAGAPRPIWPNAAATFTPVT